MIYPHRCYIDAEKRNGSFVNYYANKLNEPMRLLLIYLAWSRVNVVTRVNTKRAHSMRWKLGEKLILSELRGEIT